MTTTTIRDLDRSAVLDVVVSSRRAADREEARLLAAAVHWVDLHPVTDEDPAAVFRAGTRPGPLRDLEVPLAGEGTPGVAAYAVEELAAALGLSYAAGMSLVSEAVALCFRLPRLWALVHDGHLQSWKARRVARATTSLSRESVAFVDRHLAVAGRHNRVPVLGPVLHEARLQCDPDQALAVEQSALDHRGVWLDHRESTAITILTARLDTLDALDLDGSVSDLASTIGRLGDTRPLDVRRATALGMLAHPQRAIDLVTGDGGVSPGLNGSRGTLHLHVDASDLQDPSRAGGSVERLGPATLELLGDWLRRFSGFTVRPVLDLARTDAVDAHDPPGWMRELVMQRDGGCVFPGCTVDARSCDLDHLAPHTAMDEGGPPGQTSPANLACLCRRHHRLKTFAGWAYRRLPDDPAGDQATIYEWTSPLERTYRFAVTDKSHSRSCQAAEPENPS
ncbi:hypothetical protein BH10ACT10_BH10ACT10_24990 [soil metagenome]